MPGYAVTRTQKALPIGSVQPWGGDLSEIPSGWLLCNNQELNAGDYPLLARVLRDTYGGTEFDGTFPNYTGTFRLPPMNDKACADISTGYFGLYSGSNTTAWSAGGTVYDGDIIISSGKYYLVILTDTEAISGVLGTSAPTHTVGTQPNSTEVNLKAETIVPGAVPAPIDNPGALNIVKNYIGDSIGGFEPGDLGPPNVQNARTDITLTYVPDPNGTIVALTSSGTAPSVTSAKVYTVVGNDIEHTTNVDTGTDVQGEGAAFLVVINDDQTYSVATKAKGSGYEIGDQLKIAGDVFVADGGASPANDLIITIAQVGNSYFEGFITGQSIIKGFGIKDVYIVPRKLGRYHMPQHYHQGLYTTLNLSDVGDRPGQGACVFANPEFTFADFGKYRNPCPPEQPLDLGCPIDVNMDLTCSAVPGVYMGSNKNQITNMKTSPWSSGPGRFAIAIAGGGLPIKGYIPAGTSAAGHGVGKTWFTQTAGVKNLRDASNNTTSGISGSGSKDDNASEGQKLQWLKTTGEFWPGFTIPFSDSSAKVATPNYLNATDNNDPGGIDHGPTETLFNIAAIDFLQDAISNTYGSNDVIETHDHDGTYSVQYDGENIDVSQSIPVKAQPLIIPDDIKDALQITFTTRVASLTMTNLIRAY
jgi:microcystin-dependent protein